MKNLKLSKLHFLFSGLVSTSLMAALSVIPVEALMGTYMVCSTALAGAALGELLGNKPLSVITTGVFFGLTQTVVTNLLGVSQESRVVRGILPFITTSLPFVIFTSMERVNAVEESIFLKISVIAVVTSLVGTVALSYFRSQPQASVTAPAEGKRKDRVHHYSRWGSSGEVEQQALWKKEGDKWAHAHKKTRSSLSSHSSSNGRLREPPQSHNSCHKCRRVEILRRRLFKQ